MVPQHLQAPLSMAPGIIGYILWFILLLILCLKMLLALLDLLEALMAVVMPLPSSPAPIHGKHGINFKEFLELRPYPLTGRADLESPLRITSWVSRSRRRG